jgi:hypothetical protein
MFHQGARVKTNIPPTKPPLPSRAKLESIEFNAKAEAHRMALANINRPWARRWLKATGKSF